jgi:hypothetical protein
LRWETRFRDPKLGGGHSCGVVGMDVSGFASEPIE